VRDETTALGLAAKLAHARSVGSFIDQTMTALEHALTGSIVSFNRLNFAELSAVVTFRPYQAGREVAVDGVWRLLDEHPLFRWYTSQPDWSPARISDVMAWEQFRTTRLYLDVLAPAGGDHGLAVMLTPTITEREWVWFMASRADRDFTDAELALCVRLQPALVALYATLSLPHGASESVVLTRRELYVLRYLAGGLTAEAMARRLSISRATVRKHLQNLYAKLGTSDRLGAVIRGRDLGLLRADELSRVFTWEIRADLEDTADHGSAR
jgi:DNA-binding CsgD family transcriptional regulator